MLRYGVGDEFTTHELTALFWGDLEEIQNLLGDRCLGARCSARHDQAREKTDRENAQRTNHRVDYAAAPNSGLALRTLDSPFPVNPAGFVIHSAVHGTRHDVMCEPHTHTLNGVAVSSQRAGQGRGALAWPGPLRRLDHFDPSYRT